MLGKDHHDSTAQSYYNNVGLVMESISDAVGALEVCSKDLAFREKVFGEEHLHTADSYNNIGHLMEAICDNIGTLDLCSKALAIREKVLGKEHPDTSQAYNNIGARDKGNC